MLKATSEIEIISLDQLGDQSKSKHPWKIYAFAVFATLSLILVNVWPDAKTALYGFGMKIHSFGLLGPLLFLLFNGLIVIPLALPYIIFEMAIALMMPDFVYAVCFSFLGKMLGGGVSYVITKYTLKQKIKDSFKDMKIFMGIEHVMQKDPIKFSIILRIVTIPLFIKNYGLAVPDSVNFKLYMLCNFIATVPTTAINIYLFKQAGNIGNVFSPEKSWIQKIVSIGMITLSVLLMAYIARYTRKVIKELEGASSEDEENMSGKHVQMVLECKPVQDIELKSTEISTPEETVELQDEIQVTEEDKIELEDFKSAL